MNDRPATPSHTIRRAHSRFRLQSARVPRSTLTKLAKLFDEISREARERTATDVKQKKASLMREAGKEVKEQLEVLADVADHALLPGLEITGDEDSVYVTSHDPAVFENASALPSRIEKVLMEFGTSEHHADDAIGGVQSTSMVFLREIQSAGTLRLRLQEGAAGVPVAVAQASAKDETWAEGTVGRIRHCLEPCSTRTWYVHSPWFRVAIQTVSAGIFLGGVVLIFGHFAKATNLANANILHVVAVVVLVTVAWLLGYGLTKYVRWLFPLLEIDPLPADARARHKRWILWLVGTVFLPLVLAILLRIWF